MLAGGDRAGQGRRPRVEGARTIVGAGGGKVLDTARAAAADLGLPVVNCPTVASSDAPCSALSVIYTEEGVFEEYRFYRKNPDLVLVDTAGDRPGPAAAPGRGHGRRAGDLVRGQDVRRGARQEHARAAARPAARRPWPSSATGPCSRTAPRRCGPSRRKAVTPALERLVEANTLLSGLGFESSGLAAAHAVHNGLTAAAGTHPYLHGEKVAFGLLVQLVLEGSPRATVEQVLGFSTEVGLPITLAEIGLPELPRRPARPDRPPRHGPGRDDPQRAVRGHARHGRRRESWPPTPWAETGKSGTAIASRGLSGSDVAGTFGLDAEPGGIPRRLRLNRFPQRVVEFGRHPSSRRSDPSGDAGRGLPSTARGQRRPVRRNAV